MDILNVDYIAIDRNDSNHFLSLGAELYNKGKYLEAIEYYELAAAMGNSHAISNLGYCYLYGRGIPKDEKKALLYFNIAANKNDIDALYKIGTFYLSGKYVTKDKDIAMYFLNKAFEEAIENYGDLTQFPSLCLTLAKEYMEDDEKDPLLIYKLLTDAKVGYEYEIGENGASYYTESYNKVLEMLDNPMFEEIEHSCDCDGDCGCGDCDCDHDE